MVQIGKDAIRINKLEKNDSPTFRIMEKVGNDKRLKKAEPSSGVCYGYRLNDYIKHI